MRTLIQDVEVRWHWQQYILNVAKASRAKEIHQVGKLGKHGKQINLGK